MLSKENNMKRIIFICAIMNIEFSFAAAPMDVEKGATNLDKKAQAEAIEEHRAMMKGKMNENSHFQDVNLAQLAQLSDAELQKDIIDKAVRLKFIARAGCTNPATASFIGKTKTVLSSVDRT